MKILIAPLAAMAEIKAPFARASALALAARAQRHEVAFCAAKDINYHEIDCCCIENYEAPCPSPMGLPNFIGKRIVKLIQLLGIQQRREVHSFEEILYLIGATASRFFPWDVASVRTAIRAFKPHIVYAEFRPAAIVAAKLEHVPVATGFSYPVQTTYASNPEFSQGVRDFLQRNELPPVHSALEIFDWADYKIVASSFDLEPIKGENVFHVGPFTPLQRPDMAAPGSHIVAHMGNGTLSPRQLLAAFVNAFSGSEATVYLASQELSPTERGNIHVSHEYDFNRLMPGAAAYINHGGQNSIMTGLIHGTPQIMCPGRVFERQYNANSVEKLGAGLVLSGDNFHGDGLKTAFETIRTNPSYRQNAQYAGEQLSVLGGAQRVIEIFEKIQKNG